MNGVELEMEFVVIYIVDVGTNLFDLSRDACN